MTNIMYQLFTCVILGFLSQNLALSMGICSGNMLKLSRDDYNKKRKPFFLIMFIVTFVSALLSGVIENNVMTLFESGSYFAECIRPFFYIVIIAIIELILELVLSNFFADFREKLGDLLQSACFNSGVLAILLLNKRMELPLFNCIAFAFTATLGLWISVLLVRALQERVQLSRCPDFMKGAPIALLAAGILSMAFMGVVNITFPFLY